MWGGPHIFAPSLPGIRSKRWGVVAKAPTGAVMRRMGEFVITETGLEGGVIYAVAPFLRDEIEATGRGYAPARSGSRS
jgi:predicted flavoprotein YhiN